MCIGPEDETYNGEVVIDNTVNDNRSEYADEDPDPMED